MTQTSINGEPSPGTPRLRRVGTALQLIACAVSFSATSTPVLAEDLQLSPVRRTTIASADPEASLHFYRDLLGFTVEYDVVATEPGQLAAFFPLATQGRAIALRSGEKMGGSIGLFHTPSMKRRGQCKQTADSGAVAILLLTNDLDALYRRLKTAAVPFVNEPHNYDAGRGHGPIGTFAVFDPDCVRIAFAQIKRETLEQSERR